MRDILTSDFIPELSDPDPVRRAQIQMRQQLPKRFYKDVTVSSNETGFGVLLDGRPVKTPGKNLLIVPTESAAALLAAEWEAQKDVIDPVKMPVTRLANTAIEGIQTDLDAVFNDIVSYAGTDLICYRATNPESLVALQTARWDPVLSWADETLGARFELAEGIVHKAQREHAIAAFSSTLAKHRTALKLAALHVITTLTGSAIVALAFAEGHLSAEQAWLAAHADDDWSRDTWGEDDEAEARRAFRWRDMKAATDVFRALQ